MRLERALTQAERFTHTNELLTHAARRAQDKPAYVAYAFSRGSSIGAPGYKPPRVPYESAKRSAW
jgi:hypothetical protein